MKKKTILAIFAILLAVIACLKFRQQYPEITWPVIGQYEEDPDSPSENGSPYKLYYEDLASIEKQAYNMILDKIYDMPEKILVPDLTEDELDNVFKALLYDNPDLFFVGRKCTVTSELWNDFFSVDYIISKDEYAKEKEEVDKACDEMLAKLTNPDSQYQTELEIHNMIIDKCTYTLDDNSYVYSSVYGALVEGKAACEGYSKAAKMLFDMSGIESAVITGNASSGDGTGGAHMWNIVNIDGSYYHLDLTWDDPVTNGGSKLRLYTYFNVSDATISKTHSDFSLDIECLASDANYYKKNNLTYSDYSRTNEISLANTIKSQYKSGVREIQINFGNEKSYNTAYDELITDGRIYYILRSATTASGEKLTDKLSGYYENKDTFTLTLVFD